MNKEQIELALSFNKMLIKRNIVKTNNHNTIQILLKRRKQLKA